MRAPGIGDKRRRSTAGRSSRRSLKLNQNEVFEARLKQLPRGRESGDAPSDDHNARALPLVLGRGDVQTVTQPMPDDVRRADDFAVRHR